MKKQTIPINSVRLCLDQCCGSQLRGTIAGVALETPIAFTGLRSFVTGVDTAFDQIGRPQPHQLIRSFKEEPPRPAAFTANPVRRHSDASIAAQRGQVKTLDLIMLSRRHAEWQGLLKDTEHNIIGRFNSALECVQLITREEDRILD